MNPFAVAEKVIREGTAILIVVLGAVLIAGAFESLRLAGLIDGLGIVMFAADYPVFSVAISGIVLGTIWSIAAH